MMHIAMIAGGVVVCMFALLAVLSCMCTVAKDTAKAGESTPLNPGQAAAKV